MKTLFDGIQAHITAKPFLKWAGGKTQLLKTFARFYPQALKNGSIKRYIEPFVGSGAVLFDVIQKYKVEEALILDINPELILAYEVIKRNADDLIDYLEEQEKRFLNLDKAGRKEFYYRIRSEYNQAITGAQYDAGSEKGVKRAGQLIFLNKTCFNGLFRVNRSGAFNVPMGDYKHPVICDAENLKAVHRLLQNVVIIRGHYKACEAYADDRTFVYFDPPYRPLNATSSFTAYIKDSFNDDDQRELADFYRQLDKTGAKLMLSNSEPKNVDENDTFFDELYGDRGFYLYNVAARRPINSKSDKRGVIKELLVTNYPVDQNK